MYKGNNGGEREAGHHRHNRKENTTMVWPRKKDARREDPKINYGMDTRREKEKSTSKKNVDGRSTSSHDIKKFRTRSVEKQGGMAFGLTLSLLMSYIYGAPSKARNLRSCI